MIVLLAVLLTVAALGFVFAIRERDIPDPVPVSPIAHLEDRKRAIYDNLRDLQFEFRLGKLSDEDYQATKQSLQKELAGVLSETEATLKSLGLQPAKIAAKAAPKPATVCSACGARFSQALKFCGECGKVIA